MQRLPVLFCLLLALGASTAAVHADERPLIWEFSKASDTSYSARVGSRLPTRNRSSVGADLRMRGPDIASFRDPLSAWISASLIERRKANDIQALDIDARIDSGDGNRTLTIRNNLKRSWILLEAEVNQELSIEFRPAEERRRHIRQRQSVFLKAPRTGTEFRFGASRLDDEPWRTNVTLSQNLNDTIELTASVTNPGKDASGRLGARYHYKW